MSEEQEQVESNTDDKTPKFELYIKASQVDGVMKGSCPICQQWFMIAFLLAEEDDCGFKVFTVQANNPPKSFLDQSLSKTFPTVIGLAGYNNDNSPIEKAVYDSIDEVERFFESINSSCPKLKRTQKVNEHPLRVCADLYKNFKLFLQNKSSDGRKLLADLNNLNSFLEEQDQPFLTGSSLTYADCSLLPKLQHIRSAGEYYRGFKIPREMFYIWRYLDNGYKTKAFASTMPTDQDIALQYEQIAKGDFIKGRPTLQKPTFTLTVPKGYLVLNGNQNGEQEEEQQVEEQQEEDDGE